MDESTPEFWPGNLLSATKTHRERLLAALLMTHRFGKTKWATVSQILDVVSTHGYPKPSNPPRDLAESCKKKQIERGADGKYRILNDGEKLLAKLANDSGVNWVTSRNSTLIATAEALQLQTDNIASRQIREYMEECLLCLSVKAKRAAVVLAWSGAVMTIRFAFASKGFDVFNAVAKKCTHVGKVHRVRNLDDFEYVTDKQLLGIAKQMNLLTKTTHGRLENALDLRKACAHPNNSPPVDAAVSGMIQELVDYVFVPLGKQTPGQTYQQSD